MGELKQGGGSKKGKISNENKKKHKNKKNWWVKSFTGDNQKSYRCNSTIDDIRVRKVIMCWRVEGGLMCPMHSARYRRSDTTSVGPGGAASAPFSIDLLRFFGEFRLNPLSWEQDTRLNEKIRCKNKQ